MIEIISATRLSQHDFWSGSPLGKSLKRLAHDKRLIPYIAFENHRSLPQIFNSRINANNGHEILVFIHDDVWIDDYFLADRVIEGFTRYDVIGVAGNIRRVPNQPAWAFVDNKLTWDDRSNLSGAVAHGIHPFGAVSFFGPAPAECALLDGVFLAVKKSTLTLHQIQFDPRFNFHFYDMDFCRSAQEKGLRLGTWPICLTHQSGGIFGSQPWIEERRLYLDKWDI